MAAGLANRYLRSRRERSLPAATVTGRVARRDAGGFNVLEILVVLSVLLTASVMSTPPLANLLHRTKVEAAVTEMSGLLRASRSIAVTRGTTTVARIDPDGRSLIAFADVHGDGLDDDPDGAFGPLEGQPPRRSDYEIGRVELPPGAAFAAPDGAEGLASIDGFANAAPFAEGSAVFLADGSIQAVGAFRVADARGNHLQIVATPRTSVRIEVLKWDGSRWLSRGEEGAWTWR